MAKLDYTFHLGVMVEDGYINVVKHPSADLYLYTYSKICQVKKVWNEETCMCRGIICDSDLNIVARPFGKFFNYEEIEDKSTIPNLPFEVYEKLDGSLGILYWIDDIPYICTKGSFTSEQGEHATMLLHTKYKDCWDKLDKSKTYLFEIIYPEDIHIVKYGDLDDIFLLAVIDTETGEEDNISNWSHIFKATTRYDGVKDWKEVRNLFSGDNKEGFVVKFSNNFRLKLKYEQYFKLHFFKSMLNPKYILENIIDGNLEECDRIIREFDEENQIYYHNIVKDFYKKFFTIERECREYIETIPEVETQRELAEYILKHKYNSVIFAMVKDKKYDHIIWRIIKKEGKENKE